MTALRAAQPVPRIPPIPFRSESYRSQRSASVLANEIFIVTYVFTAILVSSALTRLIRRNGGSFSQTPAYSAFSTSPARGSDSPISTMSGSSRSRITLPSAMNSGL